MLTATQKAQIIFYLGYSASSIIPGSTDFDRILANRMESLTPEAEVIIEGLLTQIGEVRGKLSTSSSRMLVKKVGDIELNSDEHVLLGSEHRRLLRDLSSTLGINIPLSSSGGGRSFAVVI